MEPKNYNKAQKQVARYKSTKADKTALTSLYSRINLGMVTEESGGISNFREI